MFATLAGVNCTSVTLTIPMWESWSAVVHTDATTLLEGSVTLAIGKLALVGAVRRGMVYAGTGSFLVVGGADRWSKVLPAQAYQADVGIQLSAVLEDAARLAGEKLLLEPGEDRGLGTAWTRSPGCASRVLHELAPSRWWMAPDGVTHVGPRADAALSSKIALLNYAPERGVAVLAPEDLVHEVMPGRRLTLGSAAHVITSVTHRLSANALRSGVTIDV